MDVNNNLNSYNSSVNFGKKEKPVKVERSTRMNVLATKVKEILLEQSERRVPENGKFSKASMGFYVPDSDNMGILSVEYDPKDPISVPLGWSSSYFSCESESVKGLRVGVTYDYNLFPNVDNEIKSAVDYVAKLLSEGGALVSNASFRFNFDLSDMVNAWLRSISIDSALDLDIMKNAGFDLIGEHGEDLPAQFIEWANRALNSTMYDYRTFHDIRTDILDAMVDIFIDYDIILSPVTCCMPVHNSEDTKGPENLFGESTEQLISFCQTWLQNMTGCPAASVPAMIGSDNLPIGVQVIAPRYCDRRIFDVAYFLESAINWSKYYEVNVL
jgi:amidase/aspartyl-tRNA(Asn)/glutamyl-tRNA(Gln) amidotransferase subunit A